MRTIVPFFTFFVFTLLFSQEYKPLLSENNTWHTVYNEWGGNEGMMYVDYQYRVVDEVTNFNGKEFKAIESRQRTRTDETPPTEWSNWEIGFYLHENIATKKVYIYYEESPFSNTQEPAEFLLYDFNLNVGDVVPLNGFLDNHSELVTISSISYENIFGLENVKTYQLEYEDFDVKIYEGIGLSTGLNTVSLYYDAGYTLTNFTTLLSVDDVALSKTKVYPNPFKNRIQIQNKKEIKELQLFNSQGELLSLDSNVEELNTKLGALVNAVYFLKINYQNSKSEIIKLIKSN